MKSLTKAQWVLFSAAAACLILSAFFAFCMVGYFISALAFLGFAACFIFFGVLAPKKAIWARRLRIAMAALLLIGFGMFLSAEIPVLRDAHSDGDTSAPYLVVCGAGIRGAHPSLSMLDRLRESVRWLEENPDGIAVLSGSQGPDEALSEAQVMFDWLTGQGVDEDRLLLEEQADNSYENIGNSLDVIAASGGDRTGRVAILSSDYHLHRLGYMAERLGCQPVLVAARTSKTSLFVNYAIREALAMWKIRVFGM